MSNKSLSHNVQVYLRVIKPPLESQIEECISVFGLNEIQITLPVPITKMEKNDVFKKREKLAYSPEGRRTDDNQRKNSQEPFQEIISSQDAKVFKFDRVFDSNRKLQNIYSDALEKNIEDSWQKKNTCLLFNIGKSDTLVSSEKTRLDADQGILFRVAETLFNKGKKARDEMIPNLNKIKLSIVTCGIHSSKFFDLVAPKDAEISDIDSGEFVEVTSIEEFELLIDRSRNEMIQKKLIPSLIIYRLKVDADQNSQKVILIDVPHITEKQDSKADNQDCPFNVYIRTIYQLLTFGPSQTLKKERFFKFLTANCDVNTKYMLFANLQSLSLYYQQNLNLLNCLSKIYETRQMFESLFYSFLQQSTNQKLNLLNNQQKEDHGIIKEIFLDKKNIQGDDNKENEPGKLIKTLEADEAVTKLQTVITKLQAQLREKDSKINFLNQKILEIGKSLYEHEKRSRNLAAVKMDEQTDPMTPPKTEGKEALQMKLNLQSNEINHLRSAILEAETRLSEQLSLNENNRSRIIAAKLVFDRLNGTIGSFKEEVRILSEENENLRNTCQILTKRNESLCQEISDLGAKFKQILTTNSVKCQQQVRAYELKIKVMNTKMIAQQKQTKNDKEVFDRLATEIKNLGLENSNSRKENKLKELTKKVKQVTSEITQTAKESNEEVNMNSMPQPPQKATGLVN